MPLRPDGFIAPTFSAIVKPLIALSVGIVHRTDRQQRRCGNRVADGLTSLTVTVIVAEPPRWRPCETKPVAFRTGMEVTVGFRIKFGLDDVAKSVSVW